MDKQLQSSLAQVTMYSKMGRYISNKILKYNKNSKTHRLSRKAHPHQDTYLKPKKTKAISSLNQSRNSLSESKQKIDMCATQPAVGFYKVNYAQVQKNPKTYNFNRSVPHFNRDKYFCHETSPVVRDMPDSPLCQPKAKGLAQLQRMAGRDEIKGSIRKFIQDPHENRFKLFKDLRSIENASCRVNMLKDLPRRNFLVKSNQFTPEYDYDANCVSKRLDTHIIPFDRILPRTDEAMHCKTGISQVFNQADETQDLKCPSWKTMLPREKTGLMPSYMDKNINTRSSLGCLNLKTLQMNCTSIRQPEIKKMKQKRAMRSGQLDESYYKENAKSNLFC